MTPTSRPRRGLPLLLVAFALMGAATACSDDEPTTSRPSPSSAPSTALSNATGTTTTVPRVTPVWEEPAEVADRSMGSDGALVVTIERDPEDADTYVLRTRNANGTRRWTVPLDEARPLSRNVQRKVLFTDDTIVVPVGTAEGWSLRSFAKATGEAGWSVDGASPRSSARLVDGDAERVVWVDDGEIAAFSSERGTPLWRAAATADERTFMDVRIVGDVALATSTSSTVALDLLDGDRRWVIAEPILDATVGPDGTMVTVTAAGNGTDGVDVRWIDLATGDERWAVRSQLGPTNYVGVASNDGAVALAVGRTVESYRLGADQTPTWTTTAAVTFGGHLSPPIVADGLVAIAGSGSRLSGPQGGYVEVYDADDGALLRQAFTEGEPADLFRGPDGRLLASVGPGAAGVGGTATPARIVALQLLQPDPVEPDQEELVSGLLGIPTPGEALTVKNVAFAAGLLALLSVLVMIPTTMFNSALETVLHRYHDRARRRTTARQGGRRPIWATTPGVVLYLVASAVLYSRLQPGWGVNWATVISGIAFLVTLGATTFISLRTARVGLHRRPEGAAGHPVVEFRTLAIAALCVAGSRAIGFVPGYLYGIGARFEPEVESTELEQASTIRTNGFVLLGVSIASWLLVGPLRSLADGRHPLLGLPAAVAAGLFMGGVESLLIGLLPLELLPGSTLRAHHRHSWRLLWAAGAYLTALVLFRPGLVSAQSRGAWLTLAVAVIYAGGAVAFWFAIKRSPSGPSADPAAPAAPEASRSVDR